MHFAARTYERFSVDLMKSNSTEDSKDGAHKKEEMSSAHQNLLNDLFTAEKCSSKPSDCLIALTRIFPEIQEKILCEEDVDYFLHRCKFGGKPGKYLYVYIEKLFFYYHIHTPLLIKIYFF